MEPRAASPCRDSLALAAEGAILVFAAADSGCLFDPGLRDSWRLVADTERNQRSQAFRDDHMAQGQEVWEGPFEGAIIYQSGRASYAA